MKNTISKFILRLDQKSEAGLGFESFAAGAVMFLSVAAAGAAAAVTVFLAIKLFVMAVVAIGTIGNYLAILAAVVAFCAFVWYGVRNNNEEDR